MLNGTDGLFNVTLRRLSTHLHRLALTADRMISLRSRTALPRCLRRVPLRLHLLHRPPHEHSKHSEDNNDEDKEDDSGCEALRIGVPVQDRVPNGVHARAQLSE